MFIQHIEHEADPAIKTESRSGLTLIELLVAVTIIAILLILTMTVVGAVRQGAHSVGCLNCLRQMSLGIRAYAEDNRGLAPVPTFDPWHPSPNPMFVAARFLVSNSGDSKGQLNDIRNVLICPADRRKSMPGNPPPAGWGGATYLAKTWGNVYNVGSNVGYDLDFSGYLKIDSSYLFSGAFDKPYPSSGAYVGGPVKIAQISSTQALYWDAPLRTSDTKFDPAGVHGSDIYGINLHRTGVNMAFIDGRARYYDFSPAKHGEIWRFMDWANHNVISTANGEPVRELGAGVGVSWFNQHGAGEPWG